MKANSNLRGEIRIEYFKVLRYLLHKPRQILRYPLHEPRRISTFLRAHTVTDANLMLCAWDCRHQVDCGEMYTIGVSNVSLLLSSVGQESDFF